MEAAARDTKRRIDWLIFAITAFGCAYGLAFIWFAVDLTPPQRATVALVAGFVGFGLTVGGLLYHRFAFASIQRHITRLDPADAPASAEADLETLARVQRYPQRLATRLAAVAVLLLVSALAVSDRWITPFNATQLLGTTLAGVFVSFTFAVVCYFRARWIVGPVMAVLIERTGRLAHPGVGGIALHLWLFSLAVAIVPLVFVGFAFSNAALRAIEVELLDRHSEKLEELANELERASEPSAAADFDERMKRGGDDGTLLIAYDDGLVLYRTSAELFLDPATGKARVTSRGVSSLTDSDLPPDLVARLSSTHGAGNGVDVVGGRLVVVSAPIERLRSPEHGGARLWRVFRRHGGELDKAIRMVIAIGTLVLALVGTLIAIYAQMVRGPLRLIEAASERIARGDLTRPARVTTDDEIGAVALGFRRMHENLLRLIGRVSESAQRVGEVSTQLVEGARRIEDASRTQVRSVDDTAVAIGHMAASIGGISSSVGALKDAAGETDASIQAMGRSILEVDGHMEMLSRSAESCVSSIGEMAASIRQVAAASAQLSSESETTAGAMQAIDQSLKQVRERADRTLALAERVIEDASDARSAVERAAVSIDHIVETSSAGRAAMETLQRHIEEIDQILRIQRSITGGTKLLALNATIIAARAGDGADEFGVVANDIKELSIKSREKSKDIERLIQQIRAAGLSAQEAEAAGRASIEDGEDRSRETGESLHKIVASAVLSTESVKGIALSTQEQARQSQHVRRAMQKVAGGVADISRATDEQRRGSEQIQYATDRVRDYAQMVKRSTADQRHGIEHVGRHVSTIRDMVDAIARATGELDRGGQRVATAVDTIRAAARDSDAMIEDMNQRVRELITQANGLAAEVQRFRLGGFGGGAGVAHGRVS
ncbi:MAG: HAMP domain-containing protein [Deltaproteobacteria bacterium]|nr:HAMP domain-containing protein [Deltaproteobacteria bacterium]